MELESESLSHSDSAEFESDYNLTPDEEDEDEEKSGVSSSPSLDCELKSQNVAAILRFAVMLYCLLRVKSICFS